MSRDEENKIYPRALVFTQHPFNFTTGLGITISNLFKGWPKDKIACCYTEHMVPDTAVCNNHFYINMSRQRHHGKSKYSNKKYQGFLVTKLKYLIGPMGIYKAGKIRISGDFKRLLCGFSPGILYCTPSSLSYVISALKIAKFTKASVVVHIMDDWPASIKKSCNPIRMVAGFICEYFLKRLFDIADVRMVIGEDMRVEYERRYGRKFLVFQNCPDAELWIRNGKKDYASGTEFKFIFTGALYITCNVDSLLDIAKAIALLNKNIGRKKFCLHIYTTVEYIYWLKPLFNGFYGTEFHIVTHDQEQIARLYGSADALLLPFNFDKNSMRLTKYSMPTKLPAYMLSGTPIFMYAPEQIAVVKCCLSANSAFIISQKCKIFILAEKIMEFASSDETRKRIGINAQHDALQYFAADKIRPKFTEALVSGLK